MIKILSLDMQGTLTDSAFSDYFWIELLPQKFSEKFNCSIESAKQIISDKFSKMGKYNIKYYDGVIKGNAAYGAIDGENRVVVDTQNNVSIQHRNETIDDMTYDVAYLN